MFERNLALKIFAFIMFGLLGAQLVSLGFLLPTILRSIGKYATAIESFNYILLYLLLFDFIVKYMAKQNQSMQIAPYLTIPIKRKTLFNFLLVKEFVNIWNLYIFFMLVPFVFKTIPAHYGYIGVVLYLIFTYLLCIGNSLLVNISNIQLNRSGWYLFLPVIIVAAIVGATFIPGANIEDNIVKICNFILEGNIIAWIALLLVFAALWSTNLSMMNTEIYKAMQGKKIADAKTPFSIPFIDRLGQIGTFINLDIKMILRSKRMKPSAYVGFFFVAYCFFMMNSPMMSEAMSSNLVLKLMMTMYAIGGLGLTLGQLAFTSESSFFDGLMTRKLSMLDILKGKYILSVSYSALMMLILSILAFMGKLDFLFLISIFFYTIGFLFFVMFQNAVYNKSFLDHSGRANWKGVSGNTMIISMLGMFVPFALVIGISTIFNITVACYFMLITGFAFTITAKYWLTWIYNRFLKRKYINMEGFRSNT